MLPDTQKSQIDLLNKEKIFLQEEIQDIINKLKKKNFKEIDSENSEQIQNNLNKTKELKLEHLNKIVDKIKELQVEKNKTDDYLRACRHSDSLQYHRVKNKHNSIELINNLKEQRNKANEEYLKSQNIEKEYLTRDPKEIPAFLFFHQNIINKYNLCPFIKNNNFTTEELLQNRINWLNSQEDNGKLYYDLYDKICLLKDKILLEDNLKLLDLYFDNIHKTILNESNLELFNNTNDYLIEYLNCQIKTKKIKDKYKIVINNLSLIVNELDIPIHNYLSEKYNIPLQINNFKATNKDINVITQSLEFKIIKEDYLNNIEKYKCLKEDIKNDLKYTKNVKNNLNQLLCDLLLNKKVISGVELIQQGKFFKKWSLLNLTEKIDRLESFSNIFVHNFLIITNLIESDLKDKYIDDLKKILIDSLNAKDLVYKNIKWNVNSGIIEKITNLKYDNEIQQFSLIVEKKKTEIKVRKINPTKSIINNISEKLINEEMLLYIIQFIQSGKTLSENTFKKSKDTTTEHTINSVTLISLLNLKNKCIEHLKSKLKFKRLLIDDKNKIYKKFDEMYDLIKVNQPIDNETETTI